MSNKTRFLLILAAAVIVMAWGLKMGDGDDGGGYSDETTYFSDEEVEARQKVIEQMAGMRGETPPPTATPEPEKKDAAEELYPQIELQQPSNSFTLSRVGYDAQQQLLLAEFNMTGLIYVYRDVPQEEWDKLMAAESFDKWFEAMIMSKYKFEQIN